MVCSPKATTINEHLSAAGGLLPESGMSIVRDHVNRLAAKGDAKLGSGFVAGLAIALWSANSGMKAILDALNVVYEEKEKRSFIMLTLEPAMFCF
jgi:membrane protein